MSSPHNLSIRLLSPSASDVDFGAVIDNVDVEHLTGK